MRACRRGRSVIPARSRWRRRFIRLRRITYSSCCGRTDPVRTISRGAWRSISRPPRNIAVPASANKSTKTRLRQYLAEKNLRALTEREWRELAAHLAPVSESYLRRLLADAGISVEAPFGGVRQKTFDELERSLLEMEEVYTRASGMGDRARAQLCRNAVIKAKDHARLAARRATTSPEKKIQKEEMIQWMLVWLENPGIFPAWV